jgi:PAS domain S-box-containing protein
MVLIRTTPNNNIERLSLIFNFCLRAVAVIVTLSFTLLFLVIVYILPPIREYWIFYVLLALLVLLQGGIIFYVLKIKKIFGAYSLALKDQLTFQLSVTEGKYKTIIQNSHDIILITEPNGTVKYCSPSIQARLGYSVKEILNQKIFEIVNSEDVFFLENGLRGKNKTNSFQIRIQHRDAEGRWLYFECTSNNMLKDPMIEGIVLNLRDITDKKRQEEINREKDKAALKLDLERERAEREKQIIEEKNKELEEKNKIIEEKNLDISQSMNYAYRIQRTLFTDIATIKNVIPHFFLFWRPRDIVSGDFYWFGQYEKSIVFAVADCTGHGIPAALMTMIGNSLLNQIVLERGVLQPDLILNQLHVGIRKMLKQEDKATQTQDGMDIAIISFVLGEAKLQFACANNPLILARNQKIIEFKADKKSIGGQQHEEQRAFTLNTIEIQKGDMFYLFSDGYQDQFGGPQGRKFMTTRFKELLLQISDLSAQEQENILKNTLFDWMGKYEQIDDITVAGIKF